MAFSIHFFHVFFYIYDKYGLVDSGTVKRRTQCAPPRIKESPMAEERATWRNAAVLLIGHKVDTMIWVQSMPLEEMKRNIFMLARTSRIVGPPVVLHRAWKAVPRGRCWANSKRSCLTNPNPASGGQASSTPCMTRGSPQQSRRQAARPSSSGHHERRLLGVPRVGSARTRLRSIGRRRCWRFTG